MTSFRRSANIVVKISGLVLVLFFCSCKEHDTNDTNFKQKYKYHIGYINQKKALLNSEYQLCSPQDIYGIHHGMPKHAYLGGKNQFKKQLLRHIPMLITRTQGT